MLRRSLPLVVFGFCLVPPEAWGQTSASDTMVPAVQLPDTAMLSPVEAVEKVLACARDQGQAAGFTVERDDYRPGRLFLWRPHLRSMDAEEYDVVVVQARPGSTTKPPLLSVEAFAVVGRAMITTSSDQSRPPTGLAMGLRNKIRQESRPRS